MDISKIIESTNSTDKDEINFERFQKLQNVYSRLIATLECLTANEVFNPESTKKQIDLAEKDLVDFDSFYCPNGKMNNYSVDESDLASKIIVLSQNIRLMVKSRLEINLLQNLLFSPLDASDSIGDNHRIFGSKMVNCNSGDNCQTTKGPFHRKQCNKNFLEDADAKQNLSICWDRIEVQSSETEITRLSQKRTRKTECLGCPSKSDNKKQKNNFKFAVVITPSEVRKKRYSFMPGSGTSQKKYGKKILEDWYHANSKYPYVGKNIGRLCKLSGFDASKIRTWFSNKRRKDKSRGISEDLRPLLDQ
ncbi:homeodomain mating type protein a2 ASCRUDRAFT_165244 [Ascoidea rubescens DSM 1968]|uniref:Homeobox domain-containing protein n=1 Tax=Ascoidea rubescens DSM 1968 TaxID=1344418 RepID=A0A1D2V8X4_9ASCO|nr:hypothetical protein ASCRUDRAFT_165244 [Ascoidea rubescens DSM 1968]ODV57903.1 hypothetical protein ASCRUDRAFT_165244 [Ascoidea rubescens DSM 1968]